MWNPDVQWGTTRKARNTGPAPLAALYFSARSLHGGVTRPHVTPGPAKSPLAGGGQGIIHSPPLPLPSLLLRGIPLSWSAVSCSSLAPATHAWAISGHAISLHTHTQLWRCEDCAQVHPLHHLGHPVHNLPNFQFFYCNAAFRTEQNDLESLIGCVYALAVLDCRETAGGPIAMRHRDSTRSRPKEQILEAQCKAVQVRAAKRRCDTARIEEKCLIC